MFFFLRTRFKFSERMRNAIWPQRGLRRAARYHLHRLARLPMSPHRIALGFAAGAFISFTPLLGLHLALAAVMAFLLRGSIIASAVGTIVGNPLSFPFIWFATYHVGAALTGDRPSPELEAAALDGSVAPPDPLAWFDGLTGSLMPVFWPMMVGGMLLGAAAGAASYWIVLCAIKVLQLQRKRRYALKFRS